jgi:hypothetical protein
MPNAGEIAQLVGSLGSVLVAATAIIVNSRTTRANLDAQRQAAADQLAQQREALVTTLTAQAQQIRDERLWDRRMALYEDLGAWSGKAFSSVSRLIFEIVALPEKDFADNFKEPFSQLSEAVGGQYFPLLGRVQLYAGDTVRDAFVKASPSIVRLGGKYDKKNATKWVNGLFPRYQISKMSCVPPCGRSQWGPSVASLRKRPTFDRALQADNRSGSNATTHEPIPRRKLSLLPSIVPGHVDQRGAWAAVAHPVHSVRP